MPLNSGRETRIDVSLYARAANPSYTADELAYQLQTANVCAIITHPDSVQVALAAARTCGITADRIAVMHKLSKPSPIPYLVVDEMAREGLAAPCSYVERKLNAGEARTKLAFLSFSSGTTGKPKVGKEKRIV